LMDLTEEVLNDLAHFLVTFKLNTLINF